ncbi:RNA-directed DNA polymerase from mobile element jockey [Trichonephila clavata]|uniref:RNA-directed DNA polymerase from mobile element jockey n=1 Tax=Trichonephila clavata TaxID=2740835 RepID=A0A8X6ITG0_TRICU|nr:RNA-directed DNA polymerase from mobile element jockey [Trichonephila clavata]
MKLIFNPRRSNIQNLTLVSWNANGIRTRVEFREFISKYDPDIINLQETHLQPCHHLSFPNYNLYRSDRTFRGGGTAIMIKRSIPHHEIKINNPSFETSAIKIERPNNNTVTVISAYRPPRKPLLPQDLHQLFRNQNYVLVAGDLNAKHVSWSPNTQQNVAGHVIRRFCDSTGFPLSAPLEPTHFHKSLNNTVIDMAISKGMTITEVSSIPELSSDHNPVLFEVSLDNFTSPALSTYAFPNWRIKLKLKIDFVKTGKILNTPPYKTQLNKLQKEIKNELKNFHRAQWDKKLSEASPDDDSLYKIVKHHSNQNSTLHIPPIVGPMGLHYSTKNKVNLFADYLESSFQENPEPYDDDFIERVEEKVDDFMHHNSRHHTAPLTSPQEVMDIILKSPNKKAPATSTIELLTSKSIAPTPVTATPPQERPKDPSFRQSSITSILVISPHPNLSPSAFSLLL